MVGTPRVGAHGMPTTEAGSTGIRRRPRPRALPLALGERPPSSAIPDRLLPTPTAQTRGALVRLPCGVGLEWQSTAPRATADAGSVAAPAGRVGTGQRLGADSRAPSVLAARFSTPVAHPSPASTSLARSPGRSLDAPPRRTADANVVAPARPGELGRSPRLGLTRARAGRTRAAARSSCQAPASSNGPSTSANRPAVPRNRRPAPAARSSRQAPAPSNGQSTGTHTKTVPQNRRPPPAARSSRQAPAPSHGQSTGANRPAAPRTRFERARSALRTRLCASSTWSPACREPNRGHTGARQRERCVRKPRLPTDAASRP